MKRVLMVLLSVTGATLFSVAAIAKEAHPKSTLHNLTDSHSEAQKLAGTKPKGHAIIPEKNSGGKPDKSGGMRAVSVESPIYTKEFLGKIKITSPIPQRRIELQPDNTIGIFKIRVF